jgi:hypothetical protein
MASYNKQKLMRIDEQILNLEYLYERELLRECELNKHTLLLSKGFRYRLDNLYKARQMLVKNMGVSATREMNYKMTLAERQTSYDDAIAELDRLKTQQINATAEMLFHQTDYYKQQYTEINKEIIKQEARIRNKKRALDNWVDKAGNVQTTERKLPVQMDAEEIANTIIKANEAYQKHVDVLKINEKPENNATLDLLMNPANTTPTSNKIYSGTGVEINNDEEEIVEENPFLLNDLTKGETK